MWKNLRQEFKKQLNKARAGKSGDAAPEELHSAWPFFQSLLFLKDQFTPRKSSGNLSNEADSLLNSNDTTDNFDLDQEVINVDDDSINLEQTVIQPTTTSPELSRSTPSTSSGYKRRVTPNIVIGRALLQIEQDKLNFKRQKQEYDKNDEDIGFFNSMLPYVKTLSPRKKRIFRMRTQQLLYDLAFGQYHSQEQALSASNPERTFTQLKEPTPIRTEVSSQEANSCQGYTSEFSSSYFSPIPFTTATTSDVQSTPLSSSNSQMYIIQNFKLSQQT